MKPDLIALAEKLSAEDSWLAPYLLGWAGLAESQPWGAAMGFAMEVAASYGLIRGESDATPTDLGREVAACLKARAEG